MNDIDSIARAWVIFLFFFFPPTPMKTRLNVGYMIIGSFKKT